MSAIPDETAVFDDFTIRTPQHVDYEATAPIVTKHARFADVHEGVRVAQELEAVLLRRLLGPRDFDRPLDGDDVDEALLRAFDGSVRLEPETTTAIAAELVASGAVR